MSKVKEKWTRERITKFLISNFLIILGSFVLAFGGAIFLTELNIVAGGLNGIGIIVNHFVNASVGGVGVVDIVIFILTWVLWGLGFIFLSKEFALKTLLSSIVYPLFFTMLTRIDVFRELALNIAGFAESTVNASGDIHVDAGRILVCGIFGGACTGGGVSLTFIAGGSTGGLDTISFILEKYCKIKASVSVFFIDATIILIGMFAIPHNEFNSLIGIIAAFICSLLIEFVYIGNQTSFQVDIISEKWEEISSYVQDQLGRGATIIHAEGGYKGEERVILRVVFNKDQLYKIQSYIAKTDPRAFVTYTQTNAVYGEGFSAHALVKKNKKAAKDGQ